MVMDKLGHVLLALSHVVLHHGIVLYVLYEVHLICHLMMASVWQYLQELGNLFCKP